MTFEDIMLYPNLLSCKNICQAISLFWLFFFLVDYFFVLNMFYGVLLDEGESAMYDPLVSIISMLSQSEV
jgi:hypothetical protein